VAKNKNSKATNKNGKKNATQHHKSEYKGIKDKIINTILKISQAIKKMQIIITHNLLNP